MQDRKDDFWDIAALLPKRPASPKNSAYGEVTLPTVSEKRESPIPEKPGEHADRAIPSASQTTSAKSEYAPKDNPFITRVRVLERKSHMRLFHGFKSDGAAWQSLRGKACPYAPFFSFVPQYEQLNAAQKAYYLYFREEANSGNFIEAGQSYVLLYIFEILNLPEFIPPKIGILRLAKIWSAYRKSLPFLDKSLIPWLADYGILHGVACPRAILSPFLSEILAKSTLKEFYLGFEEGEESATADALVLLTSQYRYENSRYAQGEHAAFFRTHIRQAASAVLRHVFLDSGKIKYATVTKRFDAFTGALWAGSSRYELEVTYYSVSGTDDLKILMTAAVKYAENKLRAYLSIKSRLSVSCLPDHIRALIDAYFEHALPKKAAQEDKRPEYEAMYEPLSVGVSLEDAKEIEESSWENTWRLIPESEREEILAMTERNAPQKVLLDEKNESTPKLTEEQRTFLSLLLEGNEGGAREFAKKHALSYLTLGESVNEYFADTLGDVVLELCGEDYTVVSDYEDEIRAALFAHE